MKIVFFQGNNASFSQYQHHLIDSKVCKDDDVVKPPKDLNEINMVEHHKNDNIIVCCIKYIYIYFFLFFRSYFLKLPNIPPYWVAFWKASIGGQSNLDAMEQRVKQAGKEDIILYGVSRGGLVVTKYCSSLSFSNNIKGIILEGAPISIREVITQHTSYFHAPILKLLETFTIYSREALNDQWILNIPATIPILIISSKMDTIVPVSHAVKMYNLLQQNSKRQVYLIILKTVDHNFYGTTSLFQSKVTKFIKDPTNFGESRMFIE